MAASQWFVFDAAKFKIGNGTINLSAPNAFRMSLHRTSASALITGLSAVTVWSSVGDVSSGGGWGTSASGAAKANSQGLTLAGVSWGTGASGGQQKWDCTDPVFTASASILSAVRFAVIRYSAGTVNSGHLVCYAALSTAEFDVATSNTLTIQMAATGIFTLA
jgi:glutamate synthase domain-containing protein 2